jgi:polyisoprenoid-binding protein YceI
MSTATETRAYVIDASHSSADFSVRHLVISKVRGSFRTLSGTLAVGEDGIPASITAEIDATSIDTREPQRDGHLRSEDFLHVEAHPTLTFASTKVTASDATHFSIEGNLTLRGATKPVTLAGELEGRAKDPWGNDRVAYSAKTRINRKDFGLVWS